MKTQKILYIITKSNWGGAQAYVYALATVAKEAGTDVVVALGGTGGKDAAPGELAKRLADAGVRVVIIPSLMRDMSLMSDVRAYRELLRIIKKERPTVVHVNSSKAGGISALAGRVLGVKRIIFTAHGLPHEEPRPFFSRALIWIATYATVLLSTKTIVLSQQQFLATPALFVRRKRLVCIPNGIEPYELFPRATARGKCIEQKLGLAQYSRWVVSTAELNRNKNINVLIDAFVRVAHDTPDVALVLFNEGDQHGALAKQARRAKLEDRIFFMGFVEQVHKLLYSADIFVLSSEKEGFPFALLEAGIAKCPVVATDVGGVSELINTNENGILVTPGNTVALSNALTDLLTHTQRARELGTALSKRVREKFSQQEMIARTFALYSSADI